MGSYCGPLLGEIMLYECCEEIKARLHIQFTFFFLKYIIIHVFHANWDQPTEEL